MGRRPWLTMIAADPLTVKGPSRAGLTIRCTDWIFFLRRRDRRLPVVSPTGVDPRAVDRPREHELRTANVSGINELDQQCPSFLRKLINAQKGSIPSWLTNPHAARVGCSTHSSATRLRPAGSPPWTIPSWLTTLAKALSGFS
jgi:hypothetical protein